MAWTTALLDALEKSPFSPMFLLRSRTVASSPGLPYTVGTHAQIGCDEATLALHGIVVDGPELNPRGPWKSTVGAWQGYLVTADFTPFLTHVTRGTVLELCIGFAGWDPADFETIAIGRFRDLKGKNGPAWRLDLLDIPAAARGRMDVTAAFNALFAGVGTQKTVDMPYTPGDTTLTLNSTSALRRKTGGNGAVKVTPSSGDPFYLSYSGISGPALTGVSATGIRGTTAVAASVGDLVNEVVLLEGHPLDIIRELLCSVDGTGANGTYDVLPTGWGIGIDDDLIDHADIDAHKAIATIAGTYSWQMIVEAPVDAAFEFFALLLSRAGFFLTSRQGKLTARAAQPTTAPLLHSGITITDVDVGRVDAWEAYEYTFDPEYCWVMGRGNTALLAVSSATAATLPQRYQYEIDLSDRVFGADEVDMVQEVLDRTSEVLTRIPERLVLICAGLRLAQLACGDIVTLNLTKCPSRRDGPAGFVNRYALVTKVSVTWLEGTVRVVLLVFPDSEDMYA